MPDDVAQEKVKALLSLGAEVERVRPASIVDKKQVRIHSHYDRQHTQVQPTVRKPRKRTRNRFRETPPELETPPIINSVIFDGSLY